MQETQEMGVLSLVGKIPWNRAWQPTPVFLPGKSHGQSLVDHSDPQCRKVLDTDEMTEPPAPRSLQEKERHASRDQSRDDKDRQVLPVMLALSCSVGIFHRSLSRNKNQFKPFAGCSGSQEDWGANGAWFTNLHSPGWGSELLLMTIPGSGVGSETCLQLNVLAVPSNWGTFFRIDWCVHKTVPFIQNVSVSWEGKPQKSCGVFE